MSAAQFVGRVGGMAVALGIGVAIAHGTAVAGADTDGADSPSRASASADAHRGSATPKRGAARATAVRPAASTPQSRGRHTPAAPDLETSIPDAPPAAIADVASPVALPAATTVTLPAATAAPTVAPIAPDPIAPDPKATVETKYGPLGQWMINKAGQVADWVGQPYCGKGTTAASCKKDTPGAKTMQEPINTIFVVKASTLYQAEQNLNWGITISGFGSTPFSSIGYSGIVGTKSYKQFPRSGPLGLGFLGPLPFLKFQNGLIGSLLGIGPAYRDASFLAANNHLRTFGGEPDGKGNFIFTASVSRENLDTTGGGLLPGHGFESYNVARQALVDKMVKASWISGASNLGLVAMNNAIDPNNPAYTTGDADGLAQVIGIGSLFGNAPIRSSATTRVA